MERKLKIGVIGCGRLGKLHAENLSTMKNVELTALADICMNSEIEAWATSIGIKKTMRDASELIASPDVEAVIIVSSSDTHARYIIESATHKKAIFCEKPIDYDLAKINEALAAVEQAGVPLQLGFVRRFDHNHKRVKAVLASGAIGEAQVVKITSRDPDPPPLDYLKVSGGLFFDQMIHDFDMIRFISGSEVVEVSAYANAFDESIASINDYDTGTVMLKLANGALGLIDNSRQSNYGYDQRSEIQGSKGCIRIENDGPDTGILCTQEGIIRQKPLYFFIERYQQAFYDELQAFVDTVLTGGDVQVSGYDGLISVEIAYAVKRSVETGLPVKLGKS